jgi:hypothetical protein
LVIARTLGSELGIEFVAAGGLLPGPGFDPGEPPGQVIGVECAALECGQVPVDRRADSGQFPLDPGHLRAYRVRSQAALPGAAAVVS